MRSRNLHYFLLIILILAISACSSLLAAPKDTTQDVNSIMTQAAATAFVQLTQLADTAATTAAMPTAPMVPTNTVAPTNTTPPLEQVTATPSTDGTLPLATATSLPLGIIPTATTITAALPALATAATPCNASLFQADVTIPDKTEIKPLAPFTKIWRIKNTGTCNWAKGYGLAFFNGDRMSGEGKFFSKGDTIIEPGMDVEIAINMIAPEKKGEYYGEWIMVDDKGKSFGYPVYLIITVTK